MRESRSNLKSINAKLQLVLLTAIQSRYTPFSPKNSEEFSSASRSVKPGLIASGIVSAWTWAATLVGLSQSLLSGRVTSDCFVSCNPAL
jgi:hypothetical protein